LLLQKRVDLHVTYLMSIALGDEGESYWNYQDGVERFGIKAPWVSGISQGVIASALIRKYKDSQEERYLKFAKASMAYCLNDQNGLLTKTEQG